MDSCGISYDEMTKGVSLCLWSYVNQGAKYCSHPSAGLYWSNDGQREMLGGQAQWADSTMSILIKCGTCSLALGKLKVLFHQSQTFNILIIKGLFPT